MNKIYIILIIIILMLSSCEYDGRMLKGGTVITSEGDTIEFYGGRIVWEPFGYRYIDRIVIKKN